MTNRDPGAPNGQNPRALETRDVVDDGRLHSPSVARNKDVIRESFLDIGVASGRVLEIASGTGEHAVHIVSAAPELHWITSDIDEDSRHSISAWIKHAGLAARIDGPLALDVSQPVEQWAVSGDLDGMLSANMIHIAPFAACEGLLRGAGALLKVGGKMVFYGPFSRDGVHTSPSNQDFDQSLKSRDASWGVRDLERDVVPLANAAGLALKEVRDMPANNIMVVFERSEDAD